THNWSAMSNELTFVTIDAGDGGGGNDPPYILPHATAGEASAMATSETVVVEAPTFLENTLFSDAQSGVLRTDRLPLPFGPHWAQDHAQVRVSHWGSGSLALAGVRLLAFDHAQGKAYAVDGTPAVRSFSAASSLTDTAGTELAAK